MVKTKITLYELKVNRNVLKRNIQKALIKLKNLDKKIKTFKK